MTDHVSHSLTGSATKATDNPSADLPMPQAIVDEEGDRMQDMCMGLLKSLDELRPHLPKAIYDYGVRLARAKKPDLKLVDSWDTALGHLRAELRGDYVFTVPSDDE